MEKKKITTLYKLSNEEISLLKKKNDISDEKMKFDSQQYMREFRDKDFCMGKKL